MRLSAILVGCAAWASAQVVAAQTPDLRVEGGAMRMVAGTGGFECQDCAVTFAKASPVTVGKSAGIRLNAAAGEAALDGDVEIAVPGGTLFADSATLTSAADGAHIVRSRYIRFVPSTTPQSAATPPN